MVDETFVIENFKEVLVRAIDNNMDYPIEQLKEDIKSETVMTMIKKRLDIGSRDFPALDIFDDQNNKNFINALLKESLENEAKVPVLKNGIALLLYIELKYTYRKAMNMGIDEAQ